MGKTLRQKIRGVKLCCQPWKQYRGEIKLLCVSGQCLFSNDGLPWDIFEIELKNEGWLFEDENLWDILKDANNLKRTLSGENIQEDPFDETWTEEDYIDFYERL